MSQYMMGEILHVIRCVALGIILGFFRDLGLCMRRQGRKPCLAWYMQDVFFWIMAALLVFRRMMIDNHGNIRFYGLLGNILGGSIYGLLFYPYLHPILEWIKKSVVFCLKRLIFIVERCKLLIQRGIHRRKRIYQKREQQVEKK